MPREKATFRDNLERVDKEFPNKEMLNISEVMAFLGVSYHMTRKMVNFNKLRLVSKVDLARSISQ